MKILITGSSGHLGEALIRVLQKESHEIIAVDYKASDFTTHQGSITDREFVRNCMQGVDTVIHAATLHKPHIVTHSKAEFVSTNTLGTLNLLEEARLQGSKSFIFTSTTSTFGDALRPKAGEAAKWIDERVVPKPKNIYGVSKTAAEDICQLYYRNHKLPCLILKTSRFFLEEDDDKDKRAKFSDPNLKANEYLHRRVDIADAVEAHLLAIEKAEEIGFGKYIISATTPFSKADLPELNSDVAKVLARIHPNFPEIYESVGWKMFDQIGRVYVNEKARRELGWKPRYDFAYVLDCLKKGKEYRSDLALEVGIKKYHDQVFEEGPYPVNE
ncbi:MAG: NAD(P)-dependent oxidoreductase [Bacteroidia bacterium]|nr:NAD(P)-dependent oxidoreductase [Bacteroidia bacterium]